MDATPGSSASGADRLIVEAATGARRVSDTELQQVLAHVAQAGFDPTPLARAGGRLAGVNWHGHMLRGSDRLPPAEVHYLRHVVVRAEWPQGVSLDSYLESIRAVILDPLSGVLTSRYEGSWQLTAVRHSGELRGPDGFEWILVDYRVGLGYWVTAYQPASGLQELQSPRRSDVRWLRQAR
jgi:hypothetical protein